MAEAKWSGVLSTTEPRNDVGIIKVRQGNVNSEVAEFQIVQNNKPYNLTGLTVYFCASFGLNLVEKPAVIVNAAGGRIQYTFDDDSMQSLGRQKGYFSIKKEESKIDSTQDFEYQVESSLMTRSIDGKSYIYKLSALIKILDDFVKNGQKNFNTWFDSVKEILYGVDPGGNILRELIEARKNSSGNIFASLKERLDKNEDETNRQLAQTHLASYYGLLPNTDISQKIDSVIEKLPKGSTLVFDSNAVYQATKEMTFDEDIILDFNGSTVEATLPDGVGAAIKLTGKEKQVFNISGEYVEGSLSILLNESKDIQSGDTALIHSDELYNDSRDYYYKGGYFSIEGVEGDSIRINQSMPFSFGLGGTVKVITPIQAKVKNLKLINKSSLKSGSRGIVVQNAKNFVLDNTFVDGFDHNVLLRHHINTKVFHYNSGRSFYTGSGESYGMSSYTGTNLLIEQSQIKSGRHAFTVSGQEPSFNTIVRQSSFDNESGSTAHSFDCHDANHSLTIEECNMNGARLSGNVIARNSRFYSTTNHEVSLAKHNEPRHANYTFENCDFVNILMKVSSWNQNETVEKAINIGLIEIRNCRTNGMTLRTEGSSKIGRVILENSDAIAIINSDEIKDLIIRMVRFSADTNFIASPSGKINNTVIENSFLPNRYRTIIIASGDKMVLKNTELIVPVGKSSSNEALYFKGDKIIADHVFTNGGGGNFLVNSGFLTGGSWGTITGSTSNIKRATYS